MADSSLVGRLCGSCQHRTGVPAQPTRQPNSTHLTCRICRLVLAAITVAKSLDVDPLRSYAVDFVRLVYDQDLSTRERTDWASSKDQDEHDLIIQCSAGDFVFRELYTKTITQRPVSEGLQGLSTRLEDYIPIITARVHRCINFQYRLPSSAIIPGHSHDGRPKDTWKKPFDLFAKLLSVPAVDWHTTFRHLESLVRSCQHHHAHCQAGLPHFQSDRGVPHAIRLIKCFAPTPDPKIRLEAFHNQPPPYITLSHRWSREQPWKTTRKNFDQSLRGIPYDQLPKTVRDAIVVAGELGIQHLWLDSICIIQNDSEDWTQQSSQMGLIFARSFCTLAAIDAFCETQDDMGLLLSRDKVPANISIKSSFEIKYDSTHSHDSGKRTYTLGKQPVDPGRVADSAWETDKQYTADFQYTPFDMCIERSVWNTRGWMVRCRSQ